MKKLLSFVLALSLMTVMTACSEKETESQTSSEETTSIAAEETSSDDINNGSSELPEGVTFAQYLLEDFKGIVSENPDMSAEEIAAGLSANEAILFSSMSMPVEPGLLAGFTEEIQGFESASMFGPAMGSIAFIGYVFELSDEGAAKSFAETLKGCADPRWQICVEAEETVCEAVGNKVFFVMAPLSNQ
ncbi:MAG: hypothetical protein E7508_08795 [Ruminococcus sp.]|nr:hypothetical protein [Ruminococcus sp.]